MINEQKRENLKILFLVSTSGFYGKENVVLELARELSKSMQVYVGVLSNIDNSHLDFVNRLKKEKTYVEVFNCNKRINLKTFNAIKKFIINHDITIVHSHDYKSNFYNWYSTKKLKIKRVATIHNWIETSFALKVYAWLDRKLLKRFDFITMVSNDVFNKLLTYGIKQAKLQLILNGIDVNKYSIKKNNTKLKGNLGFNKDDIIVGAIGRLEPEKGHLFFLKAILPLLKNNEIKALLVGDGSEKNKIIEYINFHKINGSVILTGNRKDIPDLLNIIDIFVLPSFVEAMPMVLLEAMAAKKIIVSSKVGEIPIIIDDDFSGMLFDAGNEKELYEIIKRTINMKNNLKLMGTQAYNIVKNNYSSQIMYKKYLYMYKKLYEKNSK